MNENVRDAVVEDDSGEETVAAFLITERVLNAANVAHPVPEKAFKTAEKCPNT